MPADNPSPEEEAEYEERKNQHNIARLITKQMGLPSFFEEHEEDGDMFLDGYVYAPPGRAVEVLKAFQKAGVEVDIVDVLVPDVKAMKRLVKELNELHWARQVE